MKKQTLYNIVYGQAVADAVGYYTEFGFKEQLTRIFPSPDLFTFPPESKLINRNPRQYECDWTDDTDHLILLMDMLSENDNKINPCLFATKLKNWVENGFSELGDTYGYGCGNLTNKVVNTNNFTTNPESAAKIAWDGRLASNGSLMRCAIMACRNKSYMETLTDSIMMSRCTHYDPRCDIAVGVITSILWDLIYNSTQSDDDILLNARAICNLHGDRTYKEMHGEMIEKSYTTECEHYFDMKTLDDMDLNIYEGYVLKCMAVGVWAFRNRHSKSYKDLIVDIVLMGGDADTNAAVAGAILGASGNCAPQEWIDKMPHLEWLNKRIETYYPIV